jgi:IS4 transposase
VYPAFSLDRGSGCEIHENAFWSLQTYLGLRDNLAANEGARSFTYESTRERTPLGHNHRARIRDLSIEQIRETLLGSGLLVALAKLVLGQ